MPWSIDPRDVSSSEAGSYSMLSFGTVEQPISLEELEREYCALMKQPYPITEMVFARSWMLFRVRHFERITCQMCSNNLTFLLLFLANSYPLSRKESQRAMHAVKPARRKLLPTSMYSRSLVNLRGKYSSGKVSTFWLVKTTSAGRSCRQVRLWG